MKTKSHNRDTTTTTTTTGVAYVVQFRVSIAVLALQLSPFVQQHGWQLQGALLSATQEEGRQVILVFVVRTAAQIKKGL